METQRPRKGINLQQEPVICPSCGDHKIKIMGKIPATDIFAGCNLRCPLDGGYLCRCQTCYLAFRYPRPSKQDLDALYARGSEDNWQYAVGSRNDWRIAIQWIRNILPQSSTVLDVGCFDGGFLQNLGSEYRRYGLELHPVACERASRRGIEIVAHDFDHLGQLTSTYDCVVAFDVIEHAYDPAKFLEALARVVHEDGMIVVSSGNFEALSWRLMGARYWYCTIAEHFSFISPRWCATVAPRMSLQIKQLVHFSHGGRGVVRHIDEALKNITYLTMPWVVGWLRSKEFGGKDTKLYPQLAEHPPSWMTAVDHFMVMFRKT